MTHWQTIRMVLLMCLLGISSVAIYIFHGHELYFCMFFACLLVLALIVYVVSVYSQKTHRLLRMVESIRYNDFSLSFSGKRQGRMEKQLLEDINEVMITLRNRMSSQEERYRYFDSVRYSFKFPCKKQSKQDIDASKFSLFFASCQVEK